MIDRDRHSELYRRMMRRTEILPGDLGCWVWTGASRGGNRHWDDGGPYGTLRFDRELLYVHRASFEIYYRPLEDGEVVDHLCRVRLCWNPLHLDAVPVATNARRSDMPFPSAEDFYPDRAEL